MLVTLGLGARENKPTTDSPRSRVVAQLGQQPAVQSLIGARRELDVRGAILGIP
jgi:hypothetical protein